MNINIRKEKPADIQSIHEVTISAFLNAPHTDHTEQYIVKALRDSGVLSVSLVAESASKIVGHVALSPVSISNGAEDWYGLGPISVEPNVQSKGVGSQLMHAVLTELKCLNANGCVLLGDPGYYQRFGFKRLDGLILPGVPQEYFQAIIFHGAQPKGEVTYHSAFSAKAEQV